MNKERALTWKKMRAQQSRRKKARMRTALEVIRRRNGTRPAARRRSSSATEISAKLSRSRSKRFPHWGAIELAGDDELAIPAA